jgi:hypothetical protein
MVQKLKDHVLLTGDEYAALCSPDTTYSLMTKTTARRAVKLLLQATKQYCYHDLKPKPGPDDADCAECPVMTHLGHDAGERMCTRQKWWSK